ncbi:uncharacterized protein CLUP02_02558 [Colletotrichum lupini]|uniref:Uncharacterized protein n=1 Tax=Colletotrichum lupini TaxID=145971 RepID=A0A9Q8WBG8_9PEZI|nr:uncharacterized protein CLUP02_02558 [Colletotrichum lupini]UQC77091.1 hypothetical protein CLUP02_02558 [Colletotrichum lupini]
MCLKPPQSPDLDYTPKRPAGIDELAQKRAHSRDLHTIVISLDPAGPATRIDVVLPADCAVIPSSLCLTRKTFRPSGLHCPPPELPRFCHSIPKSQVPPSQILPTDENTRNEEADIRMPSAALGRALSLGVSSNSSNNQRRKHITQPDVCQSVQVQVNTILGQALSGNLVNLLCGALNQQTSSAVQTISTTTIIILPSTTAIAPPPPPPPPATTSVAPPPPPPTTSLSTSTPIILPPSSQAPLPPATTAIPPVSSQAPPIIPPTTIVTSTTTTENQASPQSTSSAPVNPLDALLMNGGMVSKPRGRIAWGLPVLAVVMHGII